MASGNNESVARSRVLSSLLSYGNQLSPEWKAVTTTDQRIFFVNRRTRSSHWFPPPEFWVSKLGLPYGWEAALDSQNKQYYINHVTRTTTREDPRSEADQAAHLHMTQSQARRIELVRDANIGFGFVAGSEKPVVIRSVIPNGPSHEKLFANDQILKVNGKDVRDAPQADVITLIKGASGCIELEVVASEEVQDTKNQHSRKSSLMSRTTRERRRSTPVSVRFADEPALVQVIGPMEPVRRSSVPLIPNVLKVFLENGQTRSFRYDSNTTAEEIFGSFASKLDVTLMEHFSLVLSGPKKGQISYIQNHEKVSEIYTNRNCSSVNCLCKLNVAFVPKDHFELLSQDPNAFEYLYAQVTNRVVEGFYGMDLKYDLAIKLAALQIQQKAVEAAAGRPVKISVRQVEKEFGGLGKFVSSDLLHNMREKELRKILDQQIKQNENLASPGERHMSSLQCKIHYLNLAGEIFSYGGRYFDVVLVDNDNGGPSLKKTKKQQHITVLVNLKYGVSQVVRGKVNVLCQLADFYEITGFKISRYEDNKRLLHIRLQEGKAIQLICTSLDCLDLIALITGYYKVYVDNTSNTPLPVENDEKWPFSFRRDPPANDAAPAFYSKHHVVPDVWSYPSRFQTSSSTRKTQLDNTKPLKGHKEVFVDLSRAPPRLHENAISEEPDEDQVQKADWKTLDQDLRPEISQDEDETDGVSRQQDDTPELVMSRNDQDLLEKASSFLKSSTEDTDRVNGETLSDISNGGETEDDSGELVASRKRRRASSGNSGNESLGIKTAKTAAAKDLQEGQGDLISELVVAEEMWHEEEAVVFDESVDKGKIREKESCSSISTDGSDSWVEVPINSVEHKTNNAVDDRKGVDFLLDSWSSGNASSHSEHVKEEVGTARHVNSDVLRQPGPEHSTTGVRSNTTNGQTSLLEEGNGDSQPAFSDKSANLHLSLQQDPFITMDRFRDRSPTPSPSDLGLDESKFDNKEVELVDYVEGGTASEGFDDQESPPFIADNRSNLNSKDSDENNNQSEELQLIGYSRSAIATIDEPNNSDDYEDSVGSHMVSLEFGESSETETASETSDEDESLWSTFPEFFQPSKRLQYPGKKQGVLLLAEEDQNDVDSLDYGESNQDVTLVSLRELHTKDDLNSLSSANSRESVDTSITLDEGFVEKDLEELSTASSESFEFTYEINAEFRPEDGEVSGDGDYVYLREQKEEDKHEVHKYSEDTNELPLRTSLTSSEKYFSDKRKLSLETQSTLSGQGLKVDEPTQSVSIEKTASALPDKLEFCEKKLITETSKGTSSEKPSTLPEPSRRKDVSGGSSLSFDQPLEHTSRRKDILSRGFRSLSDSRLGMNPAWKDLDRSYSPTDWIIPCPPSPTPELQEDDIQIVSPPPIYQTSSEDEMEEELQSLIVPPPPSLADTVQTISSIRIVSPPPPSSSPPSLAPPEFSVDLSHNEIDESLYDYDEIRFLSLTDDHKLAHNNALVPKRTANSNVTEDKKIQAQKILNDASSMSKEKECTSKSVAFSHRRNILDTCKVNPTQTNLKQSSSSYVPKGNFHDSQVLLRGSSPLQDARSTRKPFDKRNHVSNDLPNTEAANSSVLDNDDHIRCTNMRTDEATEVIPSNSNTNHETVAMKSRSGIVLKQKPPVPPKPRFWRTVKTESRTEESDTFPNNGIEASPKDGSLIVVEGNNKMPVNLNAREADLNVELSETDISIFKSHPQKQCVFKNRSKSLASLAATPSQVMAPNSALTEVKEREICDTTVKAEHSVDLFMALKSDSSRQNTRISDTSEERIFQRPVAFRPMLPRLNKQVPLATSQVPLSPLTITEGILHAGEMNTTSSRGIDRSLSFTHRSAYVPAPYSPTRSPTQSLFPTPSSVENAPDSSLNTNRLSPVQTPIFGSGTSLHSYSQSPPLATPAVLASSPTSFSSSSSAKNSVGSPGNDDLFQPQRPALKRVSTSHRDSNRDPESNPYKDETYRVLPERPPEPSNLQLPEDLSNLNTNLELQEDGCNSESPSSTPPPLPDSSPPPLPDTSPPKMFPLFDNDDFDFGEPLTETGQYVAQNESHERTTFELPSSAKVLKTRRSSASFSHKRSNSNENVPECQEKVLGSNSLSRSLTLTSFPRRVNRRSLSEDAHENVVTSSESLSLGERCNSSSVTGGGSSHSLDEGESKSLETKCSKVCDENLSKVSGFKKRLESHVSGSAPKVKLPDETKNWPLVLQNNARFLACDVKVISSSVKRGSAQVVAAIRASLDSLEKLVESCEKANAILSESSTHSVHTLISMVTEVLEHYRDVIATVKATTNEQPDDRNVESLVEKTNAMATLIASLIRTLRNY